MPEGLLAYFARRFPKLFLHVHRVMKETGLAGKLMSGSYFELPDPQTLLLCFFESNLVDNAGSIARFRVDWLWESRAR
ncbi:hypothetical protein P691DRAFT_254041 [Macrolepiota fuliginosa MF-IS2]|uniref:KEN domain-containing protein n=1 Tax=Macrolepiota fuliginosa MF-IS2 TaxID=1400762 RepID=A0A9P5WW01_9AGAR|nr:hypothetical protein P691DRAFT_254041 [Macrolepiota fuliginosa MF-IS2]